MPNLKPLEQEFVSDAEEILQTVNNLLVELEKDPKSEDKLATIFRSIHNLKGSTSYLKYNHLETILHVTEEILDAIRDEELDADSKTIDQLLKAVDTCTQIIENIEQTGNEGVDSIDELVKALNSILP